MMSSIIPTSCKAIREVNSKPPVIHMLIPIRIVIIGLCASVSKDLPPDHAIP